MSEWQKMTGKIVKVSYYARNGVVSDRGLYLISLKEPKEIDSIAVDTIVSFDGGHPGQGRGVAKNLKEIKQKK